MDAHNNRVRYNGRLPGKSGFADRLSIFTCSSRINGTGCCGADALPLTHPTNQQCQATVEIKSID